VNINKINKLLVYKLTVILFFWFLRSAYSDVSMRAKQIWGYQRYELIIEYTNRSVLVPPFVFLSHMWDALGGLFNYCCKKKTPTTTVEVPVTDSKEISMRRTSTRRASKKESVTNKKEMTEDKSDKSVSERFSRFSMFIIYWYLHSNKFVLLATKCDVSFTLSISNIYSAIYCKTPIFMERNFSVDLLQLN